MGIDSFAPCFETQILHYKASLNAMFKDDTTMQSQCRHWYSLKPLMRRQRNIRVSCNIIVFCQPILILLCQSDLKTYNTFALSMVHYFSKPIFFLPFVLLICSYQRSHFVQKGFQSNLAGSIASSYADNTMPKHKFNFLNMSWFSMRVYMTPNLADKMNLKKYFWRMRGSICSAAAALGVCPRPCPMIKVNGEIAIILVKACFHLPSCYQNLFIVLSSSMIL